MSSLLNWKFRINIGGNGNVAVPVKSNKMSTKVRAYVFLLDLARPGDRGDRGGRGDRGDVLGHPS